MGISRRNLFKRGYVTAAAASVAALPLTTTQAKQSAQAAPHPLVPDLVVPSASALPPNFWLPTVERLTLRVYGRSTPGAIYGVQCQHGSKVLKALNQAEATDYAADMGSDQPLFYWGYTVVCEMQCACGTQARAGSISSFLGSTPAWLSYVDSDSAARDPYVKARAASDHYREPLNTETVVGSWVEEQTPTGRRIRRDVTVVPKVITRHPVENVVLGPPSSRDWFIGDDEDTDDEYGGSFGWEEDS